jgi:hypothetical protein
MKLPLRVELHHDKSYCRFTINEYEFAITPTGGDEIPFTFDSGEYFVRISCLCHMKGPQCYVIMAPLDLSSEFALVEAYDEFKTYFGELLFDVDVSGDPPQYYRLYRMVKRIWGPNIDYSPTVLTVLSEIVRGVLMANLDCDFGDLNDEVDEFANRVLNKKKMADSNNMRLLDIMADWDPNIDCEFKADTDAVERSVKTSLKRLKTLAPDMKVPDSVLSLLF